MPISNIKYHVPEEIGGCVCKSESESERERERESGRVQQWSVIN